MENLVYFEPMFSSIRKKLIELCTKYEKDILPFIEDFDTFINFILEKDPDLSNKTQVLGKNHLF